MKKYGFLFMVLFLLSVAFTPFAGADESSETRIRLSFPGGEAIVVLDDDPAAHDFLSLLPLTLRFEDYNRTEKISYLPRRLDTGRSPDSCDPSEGSFTYYAPWGNLAVFYRDFRHSEGLVPLGRVESGLEDFARMGDGVSVRLERME